MGLLRRLGIVALVGAGSLAFSCGIHRGAKVETKASPPAATAVVAAAPAGAPADAGSVAEEPANTTALTKFGSKEELIAWLHDATAARSGATGSDPTGASGNMWGSEIGDAFGAGGLGLSGVGEGGGGLGMAAEFGMIGILSTPSASSQSDSITNTQHAGVDEGGIVKTHGDHLVVLRRGRLFTMRIGDLLPLYAVDAFAPGINPDGAWYDEMLVSNDTVVVIGYSYARGGTEVGLFDLDAAGHITPRATYHMRANDYYSSRNYASRLVGDQLIFYSPLYVRNSERAPLAWLPAVRRWKSGAKDADFTAIIEPTSIYRPLGGIADVSGGMALHTVTTCDLGKRGAGGGMTCTARGVLGPAGRVFYVSPSAVYVWTTPWSRSARADQASKGAPSAASVLYRLPLDAGAEVGVMRTRGGPIDQFSFLERDGHLNVVLRAKANGDAMWSPERTAGGMALLRVPVTSFSPRGETAADAAYVKLPEPGRENEAMHNRFVGDYVLYGTGQGWGKPQKPVDARVVAHRYAGLGSPVSLALDHGVDRIEPLGNDAIVVGTDGTDLTFTSIALDGGSRPAVADHYTRKHVAQGELRSHGFFYRSDGERDGVVGLPIRSSSTYGAEHLVEGSASVLYLRNAGLHLKELGALEARAGMANVNDGCRASCVDWYGNARPVFVKGRILALMGYEVVEGRVAAAGGRIEMERRVNFAPR